LKRVKPFLLLGILVCSFLPHTSSGSSTQDVVMLSNSIDRNLAGEELEEIFDEFNVSFQFVQAEEFIAHKKADKIIILGGHKAPEGIGQIVNDILEDNYLDWIKDKIERESFVAMRLSDIYKEGQIIYIFGGIDREWTKRIPSMRNEGRAFTYGERAIFGARLEDWIDKIPSKYRNVILGVFNNDPEFACYIVASNVTFEDGELDEIEGDFLDDPGRYNDILRRYYLDELEKNDYGSLKEEILKIPDPKNDIDSIEALEDIVYLALDGNPYEEYEDRFDPGKITKKTETQEAFDLMLKGGTPDPSDFEYAIAKYNTELQVLYWLAEQNEFKNEDTLVLATAMVNGLWVTMGDEQVRNAVHEDANSILDYFRETNEWQRTRDYYQLEDYPLEAMVALGWTGNRTLNRDPFGLQKFKNDKLPLGAYLHNTVNVSTLKDMRRESERYKWVNRDINKFIEHIEENFFFSGIRKNWDYHTGENEEEIDKIVSTNIDVQYWDLYKRGLRCRGDCGAETGFVDAWVKSTGGASTTIWRHTFPREPIKRHNHVIYFDPSSDLWKAYEKQLEEPDREMQTIYDLWIYKPPVNQINILYEVGHGTGDWKGNPYYLIKNITLGRIRNMFLCGTKTSEMKEWVLYSIQ
jgi:hypothetical protein